MAGWGPCQTLRVGTVSVFVGRKPGTESGTRDGNRDAISIDVYAQIHVPVSVPLGKLIASRFRSPRPGFGPPVSVPRGS